MSLHYDESRPSLLQRQYAGQRRDARSRLGYFTKPQSPAPQPRPQVIRPTEYWPPAYWGLGDDWNIQIPEIVDALTLSPIPVMDRVFSIREIQDTVCQVAKVGRNDLLSMRRSHNIINPRHVAIALSKILTQDSLNGIGRQFRGKDHSTIKNSVDKMQPVMEEIEWVIATGSLSKMVASALQVAMRMYPLSPCNSYKKAKA